MMLDCAANNNSAEKSQKSRSSMVIFTRDACLGRTSRVKIAKNHGRLQPVSFDWQLTIFFLIVIITKVDYYYCQYRRKHHHLRENTLQHSDSQLSSSWKIETEVDEKKINTICSGSNWTTRELFSKSIAKGSADDHNNTQVQCCGRAYCLFNGLTVERVQLTCCSHTVDRNLQCSFPR